MPTTRPEHGKEPERLISNSRLSALIHWNRSSLCAGGHPDSRRSPRKFHSHRERSWYDRTERGSPDRFCPILRCPRRDSPRVSTRSTSSERWQISMAWTTRRYRGATTPTWLVVAPGSAGDTQRRHCALTQWLGLKDRNLRAELRLMIKGVDDRLHKAVVVDQQPLFPTKKSRFSATLRLKTG